MREFTVSVTELVLIAVGGAVVVRLLARVVRWWVIGAVLALVLLADFATSAGGAT